MRAAASPANSADNGGALTTNNNAAAVAVIGSIKTVVRATSETVNLPAAVGAGAVSESSPPSETPTNDGASKIDTEGEVPSGALALAKTPAAETPAVTVKLAGNDNVKLTAAVAVSSKTDCGVLAWSSSMPMMIVFMPGSCADNNTAPSDTDNATPSMVAPN